MEGFCTVDENPLTPVQLYVVPGIVPAVKRNVFPEHTGLLLETAGAAGIE